MRSRHPALIKARMTQTWFWADRGRRVDILPESSNTFCTLGISRLGSLRVAAPQMTLLMQIRGQSRIEALEGHFRMNAGDWLVLERDSRPLAQAGATGLCMGLSIPVSEAQTIAAELGRPLYVGCGKLSRTEGQLLFRLWRRAMTGAYQDNDSHHEARGLLRYFMELQRDIHDDARRCPGRTRAHRHQVFTRLQRTRLFMAGHRSKPVRSSELAILANLSACYFSRTYTAVYGERPQATAARIRLEYAAELLSATKDPISGIAQKAGFENCCSFARAFRAQFGVTATRFRQEQAGNEHTVAASRVTRTAPAFTLNASLPVAKAASVS